MTAIPDPSVTTHAESSFDPVFYVSEFYGDNLLRETKWILDQFHDTFVDGMIVPLIRYKTYPVNQRRLYNDHPKCSMTLGTRWVVVVQNSLIH